MLATSTKRWMHITSLVGLLLAEEDIAKQCWTENTVLVTNQFISINGIGHDNGQ
jgi:hypothetical protein